MMNDLFNFAQKVIEIAKQNGGISKETTSELAKKFKISEKQ
jgi:hypothetical protein